MSFFLVRKYFENLNFKTKIVKLVKVEILKLIVKLANQTNIGAIKVGNAFVTEAFMMMDQMNYAEHAIILGFFVFISQSFQLALIKL